MSQNMGIQLLFNSDTYSTPEPAGFYVQPDN